MPRTISLVCSGICALLTTALSGQVLLPKPTTPQQVTRSVLQQRAWNHRLQPSDPGVFSPGPHNTATHNFLHNSLENLPASTPPQGFSIKQPYPLYTDQRSALRSRKPGEPSFELLHLYLQRYNGYYAEWQSRRKWSDPQDGLGASILRGIIENKMPPPPGTYNKRN